MSDSISRQVTLETFRERLTEIIVKSGVSRSAFARRLGIDRSTLSQLLDQESDRLPRAETIVAIAATAQVSVDWLLGLRQEGAPGTELIERQLEIEQGAGLPADDRLLNWYREAQGYRIRYVPSTMPDLLKTESIIRFEHRHLRGSVSEALMQTTITRLTQMRHPDTELEMCSPWQSLEVFARGQGIWRDLPWDARKEQLQQIAKLTDELYPSLRWFLFNGAEGYSVPMTIFGPMRVALYFGSMFFVLNSTEHVRLLSRHFDGLVRAAVVQPPSVPSFIEQMIRDNAPKAGSSKSEV